MDPGRYGLQQRWDRNSALEGYGVASEADLRLSGSYRGRRLLDERFSGDAIYPKGGLSRDLHERDIYPLHVWPQSRQSFDEDYAHSRDFRRLDKAYLDPFLGTDYSREPDRYRDGFRDAGDYRTIAGYQNVDSYADYGFDRMSRHRNREFEAFDSDSFDYRRRTLRHNSREKSHEKIDHDFDRYSQDSDYERGRRDGSWRKHDARDYERERKGRSHEKERSPHGRWGDSRSISRDRDDRSRSRSRERSRGRSRREDSYEDCQYDKTERRRDHDDKRADSSFLTPSATVVVKGLSQKTTEEDLHQILAEWGPLEHVRVIRERNSGASRGFAFVDFPNLEAASKMMDSIQEDGLVLDGRKLLFEYSSKPTGGAGQQESSVKSGHLRNNTQSDWMCTVCGCVNFARRVFCFQCNEARADDAPLADVASASSVAAGKKGLESGPIHVLVIRGLDENADEEMLRYEFSKHAPVKDIRLIRDKFTHVSKGYAFAHFYSVDDAKKVLEATNGLKLEKNGQILRVAYAKNIHGPGAPGAPQSSSLAAAAIEAAAFSQQYDAVGWAPKEYNPDEKQSTMTSAELSTQNAASAPQSGFVYDENSGYYYDAASGFYYDMNTGLYYDSNAGAWYSYDQLSQQYIPCIDQTNATDSGKQGNQSSKPSDDAGKKKIVISAPAATVTSKEKSQSEAVQAAASAVSAIEKKDKEKLKEIKLASRSSILANKKKMSNVLTMWKQRNHEGQAARIVLDDSQTSTSTNDKEIAKGRYKSEATIAKESLNSGLNSRPAAGRGTPTPTAVSSVLPSAESQSTPIPVSNSLGRSVMGVIRSSGKGVVRSDTLLAGSSGVTNSPVASNAASADNVSQLTTGVTSVTTPFKTDLSALGSYAPSATPASGKRRFSEMPVQLNESKGTQTTYRDRAAERRSRYGSSFSSANDLLDNGNEDSSHDFTYRRGSSDIAAMPFPPGVGGGHAPTSDQSYEIGSANRAIDESNVGNRMLRSMGWQEGSGLGKDGSGITEPVQALGMDDRAGLGRHQRKVDPDLEVHASDSYKTLIQKKAIARFREMS